MRRRFLCAEVADSETVKENFLHDLDRGLAWAGAST
jgi:hypothetical protein